MLHYEIHTFEGDKLVVLSVHNTRIDAVKHCRPGQYIAVYQNGVMVTRSRLLTKG